MRRENVASWVERPIQRAVGLASFNPLPHAGTISVFLLGVVTATGLYLTLFYQYGFDASYDAVDAMAGHAIQRVIRGVHRYASAALVVTSLVHAWRIFVADRFRVRSRRWRWVTGWSMLLLVWPAGVTGYLLIWDVRAVVIAEAAVAPFQRFGWAAAWAVDTVAGDRSSSGSTLLFMIWLVHLALTVVIIYFAYRHLRRSRLAWYPTKRWMLIMAGALFVVSLVVPAGMLARPDPEVIGTDLPLDPFMLFLVPVLRSSWFWVAAVILGVVTVAGLGYPFIAARRRPDPAAVLIDPDACTGCDLCVVDCPYEALSLVERATTDEPDARPLAVVNPEACVSCGICLGSCAFDALTLPDRPGLRGGAVSESVSAQLIVACDRHRGIDPDEALGTETGDRETSIRFVPCAGVVGPDLTGALRQAGAEHITVIGCAAGDCRYGVGNVLSEERLTGERAPHLPRASQSMVSARWAAPGDVDHGAPSLTDDSDDARNSRALVAAGAVVVVSILAIAFATWAPYRTASTEAAIRIIVDQQPGLPLQEPSLPLIAADDPPDEAATAMPPIDAVSLTIDGQSVGTSEVATWGGRQVGSAEWSIDPGPSHVEVSIHAGEQTEVIFADEVEFAANKRLQLPIRSVPAEPGVEEGREVFFSRQAGCSVCHSVEEGKDGVGPSLFGVADRAATRVRGLDAEQYLWQSILLPDQYVVDGYPEGQMLPIYRERLTAEELDALIAYLMTLTSIDGDEGDGS